MLVTDITDKKREKVFLTFSESITTSQHHHFHYFSICAFRRIKSRFHCNYFCIEDFLQDKIKNMSFAQVGGLTGFQIKAKPGKTVLEIHIPKTRKKMFVKPKTLNLEASHLSQLSWIAPPSLLFAVLLGL